MASFFTKLIISRSFRDSLHFLFKLAEALQGGCGKILKQRSFNMEKLCCSHDRPLPLFKGAKANSNMLSLRRR